MTQKPKVAFVIQRCGPDVAGGSEALCLTMAKRMSAFWDIEILTTCAKDYDTWEDHYKLGKDQVDGVTVRRFSVPKPRDNDSFAILCGKLEHTPRDIPDADATNWLKLQGPDCPGLIDYISESSDNYEAFFCFTYLYYSTFQAIQAVPAGKRFLVPTAHDEWPIHMPVWDAWFSLVDHIVCLTHAEAAFLEGRFPQAKAPITVAAAGVDPPPEDRQPERFRKKFGIGGPFLLSVGRLDRGKGTEQLVESFEQLRRSQGGHLELVLIGQEVTPIKDADGVHKLGFVSLQDKWDALSACFALINASPFESLSYVLLEAWSIGKPTLCNGQCAVMVDQTRRSGCGLWYTDQYDMRAAVEVLCQNQHLSTGGPTWSSTNYGWRTITSKWKGILAY